MKAGEERYEEADGLHEFEFVKTLEPSTDDPKKSAEEVIEMTRRELEEFLKENPYGAINAERCIKLEKENKDRSTVMKYLKRKKRANPKIDYVEVTREDVEAVTKDDLFNFIVYLRDKKDVKKGTFVKYRSSLNTFFNDWIAVEDYLEWSREPIELDNGKTAEATSNWPNSGGRRADRKLELDEIDALLDEARGIERTILLTFLKTGLRTKELVNLKLKHLNLKKNFFYVNKRKCTKKGQKYKEENVIFGDELKNELETHLKNRVLDTDETLADLPKHEDEYLFQHDAGRYTRYTVLSRMQELAEDAGVDFSGCHDFRHTFAYLYDHRIKGTEIGKRGYKKVQMSHKLTQNERYTLNRGATGMDADIPDERREDYERAMPDLK
ncbi:MAG: tyrosine-type recombinase/integrase [Candidatus Nanohaloarchaea archaeon]